MALNNLRNQLTFLISSVVPKNKYIWTFGAWMGERFSDNPRAFLDYMVKNHPEYQYYWVSKKPESVDIYNGKVKPLKYDSFDAWKTIVRSKYLVMSHGADDFASKNWTGGAIRIQLYHAVAWKYVGMDTFKPSGHPFRDILQKFSLKWAHELSAHGDFFVSPSEEWSKYLKSAFGAKDNQIISSGQPRNEMLFDKERIREIRKSVLCKLGIQDDFIKIIAYLPTFRDSGKEVFSFFQYKEDLQDILLNAILIEKSHFAGNKMSGIENTDKLFNGQMIDTQELIASADLFITDYSSCIFDYLILDRPIIQFIYDYREYIEAERGLYFSIKEVDCGHIAQDKNRLFEYLRIFSRDGLTVSDKQKEIKKRIITNENGVSCEKIYKSIV